MLSGIDPSAERPKEQTPRRLCFLIAEQYPAKPFFQPFADKARTYGWRVVQMTTDSQETVRTQASSAGRYAGIGAAGTGYCS